MKWYVKIMLVVLLIGATACSKETEEITTEQETPITRDLPAPVSEEQPDDDGDGVPNDIDQCANTPAGETPDDNGCAPSQKDSDADGVTDDIDQCPETAQGETSDENGCASAQKDSDADGINDAIDVCPETPEGRTVNDQGCHTPDIGEFYEGGYVFYIFVEGDDRYVEGEVHGLIAAPEDFEDWLPWLPEGAEYYQVFDDASGTANGRENTEKIVETYGEGVYAARACYDLDLNGYDDWYLPSGPEGAVLCANLTHGDNPDIAAEYPRSNQYWASNEVAAFKMMQQVIYGVEWARYNEKLEQLYIQGKVDSGVQARVISFDICQADDLYSKQATQPVVAIREF
ncbi:thrombospondin type 3 repeat-containing protein [Robertkochia sediminum]|uniref:thrombospondin type 3 repeat-containing protein n=1 Tax=Robertkochia sediminum TaxID=2785326 RepID=UPI001932049A|nr:thrombospondin type 3 repeat-containing protein [Robertkochia sediminum]MBL7473731.1 thrombospondin type 3 repeat-containing protein [Robertkochia sediminum]